MSTTVVSVAVIIAVVLKNIFGIELTGNNLETTVTTILTVLAGLRIYTERVKKGDINMLGIRKSS